MFWIALAGTVEPDAAVMVLSGFDYCHNQFITITVTDQLLAEPLNHSTAPLNGPLHVFPSLHFPGSLPLLLPWIFPSSSSPHLSNVHYPLHYLQLRLRLDYSYFGAVQHSTNLS